MTDDEPKVWVFLVERGLEAGSDIHVFWKEIRAIDAARTHLANAWPDADLSSGDQVYEVIEVANQTPGSEEYVVLGPFPVMGAR